MMAWTSGFSKAGAADLGENLMRADYFMMVPSKEFIILRHRDSLVSWKRWQTLAIRRVICRSRDFTSPSGVACHTMASVFFTLVDSSSSSSSHACISVA
jgi:hypothetical protein